MIPRYIFFLSKTSLRLDRLKVYEEKYNYYVL